MYDALIIGAGPTGSHVAHELAVRGYKVAVFEQHEKAGKATCCTGILGKECFEVFPFGMEAVLREASSARFFSPSGESFRLEKETAQAYIVNRTAFDSAMAVRAQKEGAEYLFNSGVESIYLEKDHVRLEVKTGGQTEDFEGKTVVISSGFGSKFPQSLGLGKVSDFVMGAQAEVETSNIHEVEVYFGSKVTRGFFAWLVPVSKGKALAGLLSRDHTGQYLRGFLAHLADQGKIVSPEVRISYGGIPLKPLSKTSRERVIVVGDAAGQVKPTTGGGIYYGLICAQIAADTLHKSLTNDDFSSKSFALYDRNWRKRLSRELMIDYWARRLFERLNDKQIEHLFHTIQSRRINESLLESSGFSFDWHSKLILKGARKIGLMGAAPLIWNLVMCPANNFTLVCAKKTGKVSTRSSSRWTGED